MNQITTRDFLALERRLESLQTENQSLRASLVHLARGGHLDGFNGQPIPEVHLHVAGIGRISTDTALYLLGDENEQLTEAQAYCIAESSYLVLRRFNIPLFGSTVEKMSEAIQSLPEIAQNDVARVLNVWRRCGGEPEYPVADLHCHVPAWRVLRNHGCNGLRQPVSLAKTTSQSC